METLVAGKGQSTASNSEGGVAAEGVSVGQVHVTTRIVARVGGGRPVGSDRGGSYIESRGHGSTSQGGRGERERSVGEQSVGDGQIVIGEGVAAEVKGGLIGQTGVDVGEVASDKDGGLGAAQISTWGDNHSATRGNRIGSGVVVGSA